MKSFGNTIYAFACIVAATVLGIGIADYWFGQHQLTAFLSWAALAVISLASRPRILARSGPPLALLFERGHQ
jgi:hypothetical protein